MCFADELPTNVSDIYLLEVDDTGIEPVTPKMSMWCSTAEPIVLGVLTIKPLRNIFLVWLYSRGGRDGI